MLLARDLAILEENIRELMQKLQALESQAFEYARAAAPVYEKMLQEGAAQSTEIDALSLLPFNLINRHPINRSEWNRISRDELIPLLGKLMEGWTKWMQGKEKFQEFQALQTAAAARQSVSAPAAAAAGSGSSDEDIAHRTEESIVSQILHAFQRTMQRNPGTRTAAPQPACAPAATAVPQPGSGSRVEDIARSHSMEELTIYQTLRALKEAIERNAAAQEQEQEQEQEVGNRLKQLNEAVMSYVTRITLAIQLSDSTLKAIDTHLTQANTEQGHGPSFPLSNRFAVKANRLLHEFEQDDTTLGTAHAIAVGVGTLSGFALSIALIPVTHGISFAFYWAFAVGGFIAPYAITHAAIRGAQGLLFAFEGVMELTKAGVGLTLTRLLSDNASPAILEKEPHPALRDALLITAEEDADIVVIAIATREDTFVAQMRQLHEGGSVTPATVEQIGADFMVAIEQFSGNMKKAIKGESLRAKTNLGVLDAEEGGGEADDSLLVREGGPSRRRWFSGGGGTLF